MELDSIEEGIGASLEDRVLVTPAVRRTFASAAGTGLLSISITEISDVRKGEEGRTKVEKR